MPHKLYIALLRASIVNSVTKLQLILFLLIWILFFIKMMFLGVTWCHGGVITWALNVKWIPKSKGFDVSYRWFGEQQHELNIFSVYKSGNWFLILGSSKNSILRLSGNYRTPFPDINSHKPQLLDLGFWIRHVSW